MANTFIGDDRLKQLCKDVSVQDDVADTVREASHQPMTSVQSTNHASATLPRIACWQHRQLEASEQRINVLDVSLKVRSNASVCKF